MPVAIAVAARATALDRLELDAVRPQRDRDELRLGADLSPQPRDDRREPARAHDALVEGSGAASPRVRVVDLVERALADGEPRDGGDDRREREPEENASGAVAEHVATLTDAAGG